MIESSLFLQNEVTIKVKHLKDQLTTWNLRVWIFAYVS